MLNENHVKLLEGRGIDPEIAVKLGVESHAKAGGEWIAIPFRLAGRVVNHKYRTVSGAKQFYQDGGTTRCFWNADAITDTTMSDLPLIITEGEFDAIIAMQCGYQRVVSVPDGAPQQEVGQDSSKFDFLNPSSAALKQCHEIILSTDGDEPGQVLRDELGRRLGRSRCKFVTYPPGTKDLNEVYEQHGAEGVVNVITKARWLFVNGVYRLSELPPRPEKVPYPTGIPGLDPHYKVRLGDFTVITGIPSHGKTTFVNDLACRLADRYGWVIAVASFEQPPQTEQVKALTQWKLQKPIKDAAAAEIDAAMEWIEKHFVFIADEGGPAEAETGLFGNSEDRDEGASVDLRWTLERMATAALRHGAKVVIVDPWNEMDHARLRDESLTEYTGRAIKEFRRFARAFDVHVIVVAHPTKLGGQFQKDNAPPVPGLYDISDSAHWANKPDVGISVWRDHKSGMTLCAVKKVRFQNSIGVPGEVWLRFNTHIGRFEGGVCQLELGK